MHLQPSLLPLAALATLLPAIHAAPVACPTGSSQILANTTYGPVPGQSSIFSNDTSKTAPFPAYFTAPIYPTTNTSAGPDDLLFQNLLAAEWVIYSFYQRAVELFNTSSFAALGFPNTTYTRVTEIRDNEAGHLRIFQNQISSSSIKPGACEYYFPFEDAVSFLALGTLIEISSMAFLTGLVQQAQLNVSKGALMAVAETESRHNTWSLIDIWNVSPFAGPADTVYPYANQILDTTSAFIIPGSCPGANPIFPTPSQHLPTFSAANDTTSLVPGTHVTYNFSEPANQPRFEPGREYYAVYFHGLDNITTVFDTAANTSTIPAEFETKGVIIAVITDAPGAPTLESVLAGPGIILEQPTVIAVALAE